MKKLLSLTLLLALLLVGCSKVASNDTESKKNTTAQNSGTAVTAKSDLSKYVTLSDYKNISIDWTEGEANTLYNNEIAKAEATTKKVTDRAVKTGDIANIDYAGYYKGEAFSGGTAEGYDLTIGSGSFIDGFEDGLVGVKVGESKNLNLTFPENYGGEMAGKSVVFKVKVNYITEQTYSDDAILSAKKNVFGSALLSNIVANSKFEADLPSDDLKKYTEEYRNYYTNYATSNGYSDLSAFLTATNTTSSQFETIISDGAKEQVKLEIVVNAIAEKENITVNSADYNTAVESYAKTNSMSVSSFLQTIDEDNIKLTVLQEKVEEFLANNSEIE